MNTMNIAGQSEALFIVKAFEKGWEIAQPFHHAQPYDFVIKKDGKWQTIQVKTAYQENNRRQIKVKLHRTSGDEGKTSYKKGDFDLLAIIHKERMWLIEWENIKHAKWTLMVGGLGTTHKYDRFII